MSWVLLVALTLLALFAAVAVALRARPSGRAELALATTLVWNALIVAPIYALGLTNHLTKGTLAVAATLLFCGVLATAGRFGSFAESARTIGAALVSIVVLPFEGLDRARRARSLVLPALLLSAYLIAFTTIDSYFMPSWRQWDALWYHEPIIGWTIQNHGFAFVDLPDGLQKVNGYPRLAEMSALWFGIFTGRRLIDVVPCLIAPALLYGTFLLVRRYSRDVVSAMGWACVVLLMPNTAYLLQCTYIDVQVAMFMIAATYYATRPVFRVGDAWLACASIAMAVGSKILILPPACLLAVIAVFRLFQQNGRGRAALATAGLGFVCIAGMMAATYVRNWVHFKNPFWPDLKYDNDRLGIHFPYVNYNNENPLNLNVPLKQLVEWMTVIPYSVKGLGHRSQVFDYGFAVVWTLFPAAVIAVGLVVLGAARDLLARIAGVRAWRSDGVWNAGLVLVPLAASLLTAPALWSGRYHIQNVALAAALVAYVTRRGRWTNLFEGLTVTASVMALLAFYWGNEQRWLVSPTELAKVMQIPYPEREVTNASQISSTLDVHAGAAITRDLGLAREAHVGPGDVVVVDDQAFWPALLWNNDYSNKVVYIPSGPDFYDKATALGAVWVYCRPGATSCNAFRGKPDWHELSPYIVEPGWGSVMERAR